MNDDQINMVEKAITETEPLSLTTWLAFRASVITVIPVLADMARECNRLKLELYRARMILSNNERIRVFLYNLNPEVHQEVSISLCGINHLVSHDEAKELQEKLGKVLQELENKQCQS